MRKKILAFTVFIILIGLCAWSPWLTQDTTSRLAETQFNNAWNGVMDGCGTSGKEYGVKDYRKVPFGAVVTLDYQCGLIAPDEPSLHTKIYVTFLGTTFGYPKP
jgi:hypothetical protein